MGSPDGLELRGDDAGHHRRADAAADRADVRVHAARDARLRGRHRGDDQRGHRREGEPEPDAHDGARQVDLPLVLVREREDRHRRGSDQAAGDHEDLAAEHAGRAGRRRCPPRTW